MGTFRQTTLEVLEIEPHKLVEAPLVIDDWTLAFRLGYTGKTFWFIHNNRQKLYKVFKIKKSSGGLRTIHNPQPVMRLFAKQIRHKILLPLTKQLGPHVGAYQIGKSTKDTAKRHLLACPECDKLDQTHTCTFQVEETAEKFRVLRRDTATCAACSTIPKHDCPRAGVKIHMDLKDFFGSTRRSWIRQYFHEKVGYNHYVSGLLAQVLTTDLVDDKTKHVHAGVPQGAKTSGDICNLVADWKFDGALMAALPDWVYSRYADDLYFTHPKNLSKDEVNKVISEVERLINNSGYRLNRRKLHVQRPHRQQRVLGIVVNKKANMPKQEYRRMRAILTNSIHHGFEAECKRAKKESGGQMMTWLSGKISYYQMITPNTGEKLRVMFNLAKKKWVPEETP
jgi:hypothetical protein